MSARRVSLILAIAVGIFPTGADADYIGDLEKQLGHNMKIEEIDRPIRVAGGPAGEVASTVVPDGVSPAQSMALLLRVVTRGTAPFEVVVKPTAGGRELVYPSTGRAAAPEFWTSVFPGYRAVLEVRPAAGNHERPAVEVVAFAREEVPARKEQLCGDPDAIDAEVAPAAFRGWLSPVARLLIFKKKKRVHCTGFLVAKDVVMTNYHCARTEVIPGGVTAQFGYDSRNDTPHEVVVTKRLAFDSKLDFALLRLEQPAPARFGRLHLSRASDPLPNDLVLIGHPDGTTKKLSVSECRPIGPASPNLFGHHCDTAFGSSGSPVLDRTAGVVVGLHHVGVVGCGKKQRANEAVRARRIVAYLEAEAAAHRIEQALVAEVVR